MASPAPLLFELAAGREPASGLIDRSLVESALEHRMGGLLYSWASDRDLLDGRIGQQLMRADTQQWARSQMLATAGRRVAEIAADSGVEVAVIKGIALEALCYTRIGERPTTDLDVVVTADSTGDIVALVTTLAPRHRWLPHLAPLIDEGHIQSIDLVVDGIEIDLHFDILKLELVRTRHPVEFWRRSTTIDVEGAPLPTFDAEASLVLALLHLNKDRFRYLIGFADVARLVQRVEDWDWVSGYLESEGLTTPAAATLSAVSEALSVPTPALDNRRGVRSRVWNLAWPARMRLLGAPGRVRYRYRQMLIPVLGRGRGAESVLSLTKRLTPPRPVLDAHYPDTRGPYPWKLLAGRVSRRRMRHRQRAAARDR